MRWNRPTGTLVARWDLVRFGGAFAVALLYVGITPYVAARKADFCHLWASGHLVALGRAEQMYDPLAQKAVLDAALGAGHTLWAPRNEIVGAFFYPPLAGLWYGLLGLFPLVAATWIQAAVNVVAAGSCAVLLSRLSDGRVHPFTCGILLGLWAPTFYSFALSQNGILSFLVLLWAAVLASARRDWLAGSALALLSAKPSWLAAVGWAPLLARRWRVLLGGLIGAAALALATLALLGPEPFARYAAIAPHIVALDRLPGYPLTTQHNALGVARRLLGIGTPANLLGWGAAAALVGLTAWRAGRTDDPVVRAGLVLTAATLVNPHAQHYDLLPALAGVVALCALWPSLAPAWRALTLLATLTLFAAFPIATAWDVPVPPLAILGLWTVLAFVPTNRPEALPPGDPARPGYPSPNFSRR